MPVSFQPERAQFDVNQAINHKVLIEEKLEGILYTNILRWHLKSHHNKGVFKKPRTSQVFSHIHCYMK